MNKQITTGGGGYPVDRIESTNHVERLNLDDDWATEPIDQHELTLPPHSAQAEVAVLGSVLKNPSRLTAIADRITPKDFYHARNGHIFRAMLALDAADSPVDYHSIVDRLTQLGLYEKAGGIEYLSQIGLATPSAAHIEHYAGIVYRTSMMRAIISKAQSMAEIAYRDDNPSGEAVLERCKQMLAEVDRGASATDFSTLEEALVDYMERLGIEQDSENANHYGLPTGYIDLDRVLGGMSAGDLIILAAPTSHGKTSLALNMAINVCLRSAASVAMFSLEMTTAQLVERLLSMESGVDSTRIRKGDLNEMESRKVDSALNTLAKCNLRMNDESAMTVSQVCAKARRLAQTQKIDLLVVDYLQLIETANFNRSQEVGDVAKALKQLGKELGVPVLALCQLSRKVDDRADHTPMLSDLRESGALEQHSDTVIFVVREERYFPDTDKKGVADITVAKHRNGPTGQVQLLFLERTTKFVDLEVYRQ